MNIQGRQIGPSLPPFIVAEMSGNHNQSLDRALELVEAAACAGAEGLKIQTYTADTMTLDLAEGEFVIEDATSPWKGRSLYSLYQQAYLPWEWHAPILEHARGLGLIAFSSPFDETAVDLLESLDVPCYKVASYEIADLPLIRRIGATGKPMIISTGMATISEIDDAVRAARSAGCADIVLLKCTSTYPASPENSNLLTLPHMGELFDCGVGLSDHTMGIGVAVAAVALGAWVIEKHFTLRRSDGGVDSSFSLEPEELAALVIETRRAHQALGRVNYGPTQAEQQAVLRRRSLYISRDLEAGDTLTRDNVRCIRPGRGLAPKYMEHLLGRRVNQAVKKGTPTSWSLLG